MAEAYFHLQGEPHRLELDGFDWVAAVPCFCQDNGQPSGPRAWHWHEAARAETFTELITLLSVRLMIESAAVRWAA